MKINQYEIWIADLNPQIGTESGKKRPVLVVQTNLLNELAHPSTIICPLTTNVKKQAKILRVHIRKETADLNYDCDIMMDQIRTIDNKRLVKKLGSLPPELIERVQQNLMIVLGMNT